MGQGYSVIPAVILHVGIKAVRLQVRISYNQNNLWKSLQFPIMYAVFTHHDGDRHSTSHEANTASGFSGIGTDGYVCGCALNEVLFIYILMFHLWNVYL